MAALRREELLLWVGSRRSQAQNGGSTGECSVRQKPLDPEVVFDTKEFSRPGKNGFRAAWSEIQRIVGYKIDMFSWDEIRIEFELRDGMLVVVTEESVGFPEFMQEVERRFPSSLGWHGKIAKPAYAESRTVLYEPTL